MMNIELTIADLRKMYESIDQSIDDDIKKHIEFLISYMNEYEEIFYDFLSEESIDQYNFYNDFQIKVRYPNISNNLCDRIEIITNSKQYNKIICYIRDKIQIIGIEGDSYMRKLIDLMNFSVRCSQDKKYRYLVAKNYYNKLITLLETRKINRGSKL